MPDEGDLGRAVFYFTGKSKGFIVYDVVIIGGGVIGCGIARELSRWSIRVALCERSDDVGNGASKANSAIVHSGHSVAPGTLMARYNVLGNKLFEQFCHEMDVPFQRNGSLNVAFSPNEVSKLEQLMQDGLVNGVPDMRMIGQDELRVLEPNLNPACLAALWAPSCAVTCPYELTVALAEMAARNGVEVMRDCPVLDLRRSAYGWEVITPKRTLLSKVVVNAAGAHADVFHNLVSEHKVSIIPRKGQYWIIDKNYAGTFTSTIFQVPSDLGKGILLSPTVDGTIIIGPTAENQDERDDTDTSADGLEQVLQVAGRIWPGLARNALITSFAGVRAHTSNNDFILGEVSSAAGFFNAAGIESPGLTAAPAIAAFLSGQIAYQLSAVQKTAVLTQRPRVPRFRLMSQAEKVRAIASDPSFGRIVCRCEQITEAEIRDCIRRPVGARTVDAVKRRTRAGMGRCQGGFCLPRVLDILSQELSLRPEQITKAGGISKILLTGHPVSARQSAVSVMIDKELMKAPQLLIIGGGPAGLAAAIAAWQAGCREVLILERESELGGILRQCIHTGFGLRVFKEELTGPEYAERYIEQVKSLGIPYQCNSMVLDISAEREVTVVSPTAGLQHYKPGAIILAMGCRERSRGALGIPGSRCAGIYNAGTAQRFVNLDGVLPGQKVVILGSGDIGLIMARRMVFSGAKVVAVVELLPYSSGLKRNVVQCLDDYGIPLLLSHTVTRIIGRERLVGVVVNAVDAQRRPILGTEKEFACDTLLLSVGLIPENELSRSAQVPLSTATFGPLVDEKLQTRIPGIFACGNVLHVHDLVDNVSEEANRAGQSAVAYLSRGHLTPATCLVGDGYGVRGVVPQMLTLEAFHEPVKLMFRPTAVFSNAIVRVSADGYELKRVKRRILTPGEMESIILQPTELAKSPRLQNLLVEVLL